MQWIISEYINIIVNYLMDYATKPPPPLLVEGNQLVCRNCGRMQHLQEWHWKRRNR
jgi:hypothetical protein